VLLKPGDGGSAAAKALLELVVRAGFDAELVSLLPESIEAARAAIAARPDKVLFTGSAANGENVLAQLAPHLIPATMELGGCDTVIIRDDADLSLATKALVFGLTLNGGQTCMSPKRVFVAASVSSELEHRLAHSLQEADKHEGVAAKQGSKLAPTPAAGKLRGFIEDACDHGARLIAGGIGDDGSIATPLAIGGVSPSCTLLNADIFLPFLAVVPVLNDQEAVFRANNSPFALTASIFSRDEAAARCLSAQINAGTVMVNDLIIPTADSRLPFGGRRRSGFGSTRGAEGLLDLTAPKVITVSRARFRPAFDRPHPDDGAIFEAYLKLTHGRGFKRRVAALFLLIRGISRRRGSAGV
jgi:acyl-CoA reductase-like NAD-dependent aldehyde dehydrogenase